MKSGRVNFCPGELFLKLLARIGEWHQNLSEKTVDCVEWCGGVHTAQRKTPTQIRIGFCANLSVPVSVSMSGSVN